MSPVKTGVTYTNGGNMIKKYVDQVMVWQLHNRREIVCFVAGLVVGAIIF